MGSSPPMRQTKKQTDQTEDTTENKQKKNKHKKHHKNKPALTEILGWFLNRCWRVVEFYDRYIYLGNYHSAPHTNYKIELFKRLLCVSINGSGNDVVKWNLLGNWSGQTLTPANSRRVHRPSWMCKRRKKTMKTPAEFGEFGCLLCKVPQFATCSHGWRSGAGLHVVIKKCSYFIIEKKMPAFVNLQFLLVVWIKPVKQPCGKAVGEDPSSFLQEIFSQVHLRKNVNSSAKGIVQCDVLLILERRCWFM